MLAHLFHTISGLQIGFAVSPVPFGPELAAEGKEARVPPTIERQHTVIASRPKGDAAIQESGRLYLPYSGCAAVLGTSAFVKTTARQKMPRQVATPSFFDIAYQLSKLFIEVARSP